MNELNDFVRMICQHPDDDAPRLVFADWLDEHGHADRAEFIRLGVRVASHALNEDEQWAAGVRYRKLEVAVVPRLLDELPTVHGIAWQPSIDRGFVARINVYQPEALLAEWPLLFKATPIRYARLQDLLGTHVTALAEIPVLSQLRSIEIRGALMIPRGLRPFLQMTQLSGLLNLDLSHQGIGDRGVAELTQATTLRALRSLNLSDNSLTDASARMLLEAPYLHSLELLYLSRNQIGSHLLHELRRRYRNVLVGV